MYSVNAPAVDCDFQSGIRPDNANQQEHVVGQISNGDVGFQKSSEEETSTVDPSEIAAKILQMHTASEEMTETATPRPKLLETEEDGNFEMPGVLLRPRKVPLHESSGLTPDIRPTKSQAFVGMNGTGPSFKALFLSTVLIAGVGGGALALGMSGALQKDEVESRLVRTELITPSPTIESLIDADTRSLNTVQEPGRSTPKSASSTPATETQVSAAKQRIRNAFSAGNTGQKAAVQDILISNPSGGVPAAGLRTDPSEVTTSQPELPDTGVSRPHPLYASASNNLPIPADFANGRTSAPSASNELSPEATTGSVTENRPAAESEVSSIVDASFPNAGKTLASVNMRQSEDKDATIIAVIPEATEVRFGDCGKWWCSVSYEGQSGFVGQKYVERSVQKVE